MLKLKSIHFKFISVFIVVLSMGLAAFGAFNYIENKKQQLKNLDDSVDRIAMRLSKSLPSAMTEHEIYQLQSIASAEMTAPYVVRIKVKIGKNEIFDSGENKKYPSDIEKTIYTETFSKEVGKVGVVSVYATRYFVEDSLASYFYKILINILLFNFFATMVIYLLLKIIILQPLRNIGDNLQNMATGDANLTLRLPRNDTIEFNDIAKNFNVFVGKLEHLLGGSLDMVHHSIQNISTGNPSTPISVDTPYRGSVLDELHAMRKHLLTLGQEQARISADLLRANHLANRALELTQSGHWHVHAAEPLVVYSSERNAIICGEPLRPGQWIYDAQAEMWNRIIEADAGLGYSTRKKFSDALAGLAPDFDATYRYKRPLDGVVVWIHTLGHVEKDADGKITSLYCVNQDITTVKEAEIATLKARQAAEEANRSKSDFLANMSHEIRTPMNAIIGMTGLALNTDLTRKQRNYIEKVNTSSINLLAILNDILDFSKIEAGKLHIEVVNFKLDDVMDNLANLICPKAEDKGLEFLFDTGANLPTSLVGDPLRLGQILLNLASNALKFTAKGEIVVGAEVVSPPQAGHIPQRVTLHFWVRDTGIGMSPEQQKLLFQAFAQADTSTSRKYGGTGLGLSISKTLTELMGGRIWLDSTLGQGSTFHFEISFECQTEQDYERRSARRSDMQRSRVLVVDDNESARDILSQLSTSFGLQVDATDNGISAVALTTQAQSKGTPYDLILLDWLMPELDGIATLQRLQEQPKINLPKVVMVTGFNRMDALQAAQKSGVGIYSVLSKPVTASTLYDTLAQALGTEAFVEKSRQMAKREGIRESASKLRGVQLLLVEDNAINQELAYELLTNAGIVVSVANNGQEAVDMVSAQHFDVVLMDCQMPVMDGYTATTLLRADPRFTQLPIIAMTANALTSDREQVLAVGMNDHIAKPLDVSTMFDTIGRWVSPAASAQAHNAEAPRVPGRTIPAFRPAANAAAPEQLLGDMPGLNTRAGLLVMAGNVPFYQRMLRKFALSAKAFVAEFLQAAGDPALLLRQAHTLKGLAGNVGALDLQAVAGQLETACAQSPQDTAALQTLLAAAGAEIDRVVASIAAMDPMDAATPQPEVADLSAADRAQLQDLLARLTVLVDNNDAEAMDIGGQCVDMLKHTPMGALIQPLDRALRDYDFERAAELLPALRQALA